MIKEEYFEKAMKQGKNYTKSCLKFGFYWQAIDGDLLNAEIYLKSGNFKDSLFIVLDCIEKMKENGIEMLWAKLLLA